MAWHPSGRRPRVVPGSFLQMPWDAVVPFLEVPDIFALSLVGRTLNHELQQPELLPAYWHAPAKEGVAVLGMWGIFPDGVSLLMHEVVLHLGVVAPAVADDAQASWTSVMRAILTSGSVLFLQEQLSSSLAKVSACDRARHEILWGVQDEARSLASPCLTLPMHEVLTILVSKPTPCIVTSYHALLQ